MDETIGWNRTQTIAGSSTETVTGSLTQTITGDANITTPSTYTMNAAGGFTINAPAGANIISLGRHTLIAPGGQKLADGDQKKSGIDWITFMSVVDAKLNLKMDVVLVLKLTYVTVKRNIAVLKSTLPIVQMKFSAKKADEGVIYIKNGGLKANLHAVLKSIF